MRNYDSKNTLFLRSIISDLDHRVPSSIAISIMAGDRKSTSVISCFHVIILPHIHTKYIFIFKNMNNCLVLGL